ncbi:MAG: DUF4040 domain-containing protein [Pseudanabaenaceae cyanobacterium SKYGB_i_bin29]|nr:DUF4040 domain-containing protein [Pseudanabaenaceae cyanobacterium SKYG29]MDW8421789.1 DUF4040 domain-containing protein [Pseudanabaenaceae cyanobacterium SKYGB_i_bin29]
MDELYLVPIVFLLPLSAVMVVIQTNPYTALVMRGILGAISALVYALLGAADVSLTDALVGTMLSITLYAIAVRASLSMRIGAIKLDKSDPILAPISRLLGKHFMRLEIVEFANSDDLNLALQKGDIHCQFDRSDMAGNRLVIRVPRLYEILTKESMPNLEIVLWEKREEPV